MAAPIDPLAIRRLTAMRGGSGAMSTLYIVSAAALSEKAGPQLVMLYVREP